MKRVERAQKWMAEWGMTYVDAIQDYRFFIKEALDRSKNGLLLDACCSSDSSSIEGLHPLVKQIGLDIDFRGLKENKAIRYAVTGSLTSLPFKEGTFQVVCLHWGIEHIQRPVVALKEIYRVLKPDGCVVMMTTNICHPFYFLSKITPHAFHEYVRKELLEIKEEEASKTYYHANTPFQMKKVLFRIGFSNVQLRCRSNPSVYALSKPTFLLGMVYEKLTDRGPFKSLKMFLVASGDKPPSE